MITNPPHDIPTGHEIRQRRLQAGITLTALANHLDVAPIQLSRLERGLTHNNDLAHQAQHWLTKSAA
ncbi:MAG TPA: XRE family transcriptional regulator [Planctomycetaceae bacterium]|nr:XRE family transcriptional regulator [Planctomycetaceae bacterium]